MTCDRPTRAINVARNTTKYCVNNGQSDADISYATLLNTAPQTVINHQTLLACDSRRVFESRFNLRPSSRFIRFVMSPTCLAYNRHKSLPADSIGSLLLIANADAQHSNVNPPIVTSQVFSWVDVHNQL